MDINQKHPFVSPQSYSQFYKTAVNIINSSFNFNKVRSLGNEILDKLSESQINQYNVIEIQAFQLGKEIKSRFTKLNYQDISVLLIKVKNILEQFQKLCISLKVNFLFELFERITVCLTILASTNCQDKDHQYFSYKKNIISPCLLQTPAKSESKTIKYEWKQQKENKKRILNNKNSVRVEMRQMSRDMKKLMLGGVSLYNQSYKRHIQNRQLLLNFMDILNQNNQRKLFWQNLSRDYKETIGTAEIHTKKDKFNKNQINEDTGNNKQFKEFSIALHNKANDKDNSLKFKNGQNKIFISPETSHSVNARDFIYNAEIFDFQIEAQGLLTQDINEIIDKVSQTYQNQKYLTVNSIKKLLKRASSYYQQIINKLNNKSKQLESEILKLQQKLYSKNHNNKDIAIQTVPCKQIQTLTLEGEKLRQSVVRMEIINTSLQQVIAKQNITLMNSQKRNLQIQRRCEQQAKKIKCIQQEKQRIQQINRKLNAKESKNIQQKGSRSLRDQQSLEKSNMGINAKQSDVKRGEQNDQTDGNEKNINKSVYSSIISGIEQFLQKSNINPSLTYPQAEKSSHSIGNKRMKFARSQKVIRQMANDQKFQDPIKQQGQTVVMTRKKSKKVIRFASNAAQPKNQSPKPFQYNNIIISSNSNKSSGKTIKFDLSNIYNGQQGQDKSSIQMEEPNQQQQQKIKHKSALKTSHNKFQQEKLQHNSQCKKQQQQTQTKQKTDLQLCSSLYNLSIMQTYNLKSEGIHKVNQDKQKIDANQEINVINNKKSSRKKKNKLQIRQNHDDILNFETVNKQQVVQRLIKTQYNKQKQKKQQKFMRSQTLNKTCYISSKDFNMKDQNSNEKIVDKQNATDQQFFLKRRNDAKNKTINVINYDKLNKKTKWHKIKDDDEYKSSYSITISTLNITQPIETKNRKITSRHNSINKSLDNVIPDGQNAQDKKLKASQKLKKISNNILNFRQVEQKSNEQNSVIQKRINFSNSLGFSQQYSKNFKSVSNLNYHALNKPSKISFNDLEANERIQVQQEGDKDWLLNRTSKSTRQKFESSFYSKRKYLKPNKITVSLNQTVTQQFSSVF